MAAKQAREQGIDATDAVRDVGQAARFPTSGEAFEPLPHRPAGRLS